MSEMLNIHYGTCSWKYDSWKGLVYPHYEKINHLEEYAKVFSSVEVDQWFWALFSPDKPPLLPKQKDVEEYDSVTPDNFRFTIKAPNSLSLTHYYPRNAGGMVVENPSFLSTELWDTFLDSISDLKPKTAAVILQFEYLNKQKMPDQSLFLKMIEDFVKSASREVPIAIETRNPNLLTKEYFTLIHDLELIPVFLQGYFMPPVFGIIEKFINLLPKTIILRLHGPDRSGIEEKTKGIWNKIVEPKDGELMLLSNLLRELAERDTEVYVNVNNHYEGSAPLTIDKLKSLLKDK